jgi:ribose/xylose/arabinose/galactoside ABC-type transport system permease subunit
LEKPRLGIFETKINIQSAMPLVVFVILFAVLSVLNSSFLSLTTMTNLMQQVSAVGTVAIGAMIVILTGGIDFSAGYGLSMIGMGATWVLTVSPLKGNIPVMLLAFLLFGAALGLVNGLLVAKLKILPFIATLAMMSISQGMTMFINKGTMMMIRSPELLVIGQGRFGGIVPVSFCVYLGVCLLVSLILHRTRLGIYNYAMGGNEQALWYAGVPINFYKILVYMCAGICTGIAALLTVTKISMATPNIAGSILTDAIAAACIGGTRLSGGKGSVFGTFMGSIIIVLIGTALTYLQVPAEMQNVFKGTVILLAVALDALVNLRYSE